MSRVSASLMSMEILFEVFGAYMENARSPEYESLDVGTTGRS